MAARYNIWIVLLTSMMSNNTLTYCLITMDCLINLTLIARIIRSYQKVSPSTQQIRKRNELITELALNEIIEFFVPFFFVVTFSIAFHGPNAEHMGNLRNGYWQYRPVDSLFAYFEAATLMMVVDLLFGILSTILLMITCSFNLSQNAIYALKEYGMVAFTYFVMLLDQVSRVGIFAI